MENLSNKLSSGKKKETTINQITRWLIISVTSLKPQPTLYAKPISSLSLLKVFILDGLIVASLVISIGFLFSLLKTQISAAMN